MAARRVVLTGAVLLALAMATPLWADDVMELLDTSADPGATDVGVRVAFQNDLAITGYSVSLEFDTAVLDCIDVVEVGGFSPDFFNFDIDEPEGSVVVGAVVDFGAEEVIPASPDDLVEMVEFVFDLDPTALPGEVNVQLVDGLGSPPIDNEFSGEADVAPELVNGVFTIDNPFAYSLTDARPAPDDEFSIRLVGVLGADLDGYTAELAYDPDLLTGLAVSTQPTEDRLATHIPDDSSIEFLETEIDDDAGRISVSMVFDDLEPYDDDKVLPDGDEVELLEFTFLTADSLEHNDTISVQFSDDDVGNWVTYNDGGISLPPATRTLVVLIDGAEFVRGDANNSGKTDLADGIFALTYLFSEGEVPPCPTAADFNDDDDVDIADPIALFKWQFLGGNPAAEPFPECGRDPTREELLCTEMSEDCDPSNP